MRNLLALLFVSAFSLGLLGPAASAQKFDDKKKPDDPDKVLADLLKAVKDKDNLDARINAIVGLADFGPKAAPAISDLIDALQTKNEDVRLNAAITLGKIGAPAIKPVAKLLNSKDGDTQFYAIWTIGWIGPDAKSTVPTMIKLAGAKNEAVRRKAVWALGRLSGDPGKTIEVLVNAFSDESDEVRQAAGDALSKFGKDAVSPLMDLLKSKEMKVQHQASVTLGEIGADAKDAVPLMKDLYLAKDNPNPVHMASMIAKIGKAGVPALEAGFKDTRPQVRQAASQALQQLGADGVGVLVDGLGDKNVEIRRLAAQTLWPMRIGDKSVVIAMAFGLSDEDDQVKQMCMNGLQQLGIQAKLAAPKLKEALIDMNPNVRIQAYQLLSQFGEDLKPTMIKALGSKENKVRINTASLMVQVGYEINTAMPVLVEALENKTDLDLRMQAAHTLAQRQLQKDKVVPIFLDGLKHKSSGVRLQGVQGLSMMGGNAGPDAAAAVAGMLKDEDANVRQQSIYALQNMGGGQADKVMPVLTAIYKEGDAAAKRSVLQVCYIYGGKAKDLVFTGLKEKDASVKQQAIYTLQNLQGDFAEALPAIIDLFKQKEPGINRQQLVYLLARAGDAGVPHLGDVAVKDPDANVRAIALQHLYNMGPKAAKVASQMRDALKDDNSNVRMWAILALVRTGNEKNEFIAKHFSEEKDANVRSNLLQHIAYNTDRKFSLALLPTAMKDPSAQVRQQTVNLIGLYGQQSEEGFKVFTAGLKDEDNQTRVNAANHGSYFGQKSWGPLEEAIKSAKDSNVRQAILQAFQNTGYRSKTSLVPIMDCLKDGNLNVKGMACNILGNIGPDAADALPQLRELVKDNNQFVQNSARNAIARIEEKKKEK